MFLRPKRISRSAAHRLVIAAASLAVPSLFASFATARPDASFSFDLRVHDTGGKDVTVTDPGDSVLIDVFFRMTGTDASLTNDRLSGGSFKFLSSNSGLHGDLLGAPPPSPFNLTGSAPGRQNDLDGDGDLDIGALSPTDARDFYCVYGGLTGVRANVPGGVQIGQIRFTATQLGAATTTVNWAPREVNWMIWGWLDGIEGDIAYNDPRISVGAPVTVHAADVFQPGPTQYLSGTINTHLVVNQDTIKQGTGATLILNDGITMNRGGLFEMRDSSGSFGPQEIRVNATPSSNNGGAIFVGKMKIGDSAAGEYAQTHGLTNIGSLLTLGGGAAGTLNISGGTIRAAVVDLAAASSNGSALQTGGLVDIGTLNMSAPNAAARYDISAGALSVNSMATIGGGGTAGSAVLNISGTGNASFGDEFIVAANGASAGSVNLSGGELHTKFTRITGGATVNQTDGVAQLSVLDVGRPNATDPSARANYNLSAGTASVGLVFIGDTTARGTFLQTGGVLNGNANVYVDDLYDLRDGSAQMFRLDLHAAANGLAGRVEQSGGFLSTDYLRVSGTYHITGGTFEVNRELTIYPGGTIDFGGSAATLGAGPNSLIALPTNDLGNTSNASLVGRVGSLINYPAGYSPQAHFANVQTDGLLHEQGTPLAIPHGKSVTGAGEIRGNVNNEGVVRPGYGVGRLDITGSYTQPADGALFIELGESDDSFADLLAVSGFASLDGTLQIALLDGFRPLSSDIFGILQASSITGQFNNGQSQIFFGNSRFDVHYTSTSVYLNNFTTVPEPASASALLGLVLTLTRRRTRRA